MKKHFNFKSMYRTALLALCLLTVGVGNAWADMYLAGSMNGWAQTDATKFVDNKIEVTLDAATTYEFKIVDGGKWRSCDASITNTSLNYELDKENVDGYNISITTGEAGTYIFQYSWYDDKHHFSVYYPQSRLVKQKYIYFDVRNQTNWNSSNFDARFWFKYYDSGGDNGSADCEKGDALENWVYYALVPDHDYIGQIQMNRLNPSNHDDVWCTANIAYAKDRTASAQNCLKEESGKADYCIYWTPQWTTYCPPMSSVTLADNGTTTWGGNGSSGSPYLVPTEGDIKVHVTASASALDDANMTKYFLFKKAGSAVGSGSSSTEKTITASGTTGTKEAVIVEAYNYYNSTEGTHLASSEIYYEARTPYTISYNAGTNGSGSKASETKLKGVNFTLPNSAVFERTGYTQTGWTTSDGGTQTHALGGSYTSDEDEEFFPVWTAKEYTINLANMDATTPGDASVTVTFDASTNMTSPINRPAKTHYDFAGYWTSRNTGTTLDTLVIDANGNWIKDVQYFTGHSGDNPTWIHDYAISLYAKWTETAYTITPSVSPAGAGSVNTVTDAHLVTPSSDITATPTNAVWVFDHWTCGTNVGIAGGKGTGDNPVTVTASQNSTITAYFKHRYNLLGSKYEEGKGKAEMATGGMPGWTYGSGADFTIISYTADGDNATVDLSYTCTLEAGTYIFEIHDRQKGESLGRKGDGGGVYALTDGSSVQLRGGTDKDQSIFFYPQHAGQYTFRITYMTKDDNYYYPTVTIERPHQLHFGTGYAGIDNLSSVTSGTTGGTLAVTTSAGSLSNEDWVTYGTDVTYTPSAATGYTFEGFYTSNTYSSRFTQDNPWVHYNVTSDDNVYAKFVETSTSVTLANDGNGHVEIDDSEEDETTCGVTTTRELTAVPNEGYMFDNWTTSDDPDFEVDDADAATVTLTGHGAGTAGTLTANFTECWVLSAQSEGWGSATFTISNISDVSGDAVGYVDISLPANTDLEFTMVDNSTSTEYKNGTDKVYYMTYTNHTDWDFATGKTYNCGITTAGKGTYRFTWNITDKTMTVTYPESYQVNYGVSPSVGGSVTAVDDDSQSVPSGGYVRNGGSVTYTAAANIGFTFEGWYTDDTYKTQFSTESSWTNSNVTETQNSFAKFKSTNFVIYRTGDMSSDPRAAYDDVESYDGGTISEKIEYRMKVHELDKWYTLCLPFKLDSVGVWDESAGVYYDLVPYYRTEVGGTLNGGHYIIRTPNFSSGNSIEIANFDDWRDPTYATGWLPSANKPYIIQWHMPYFEGKYVSFFGASGQMISSFSAGSAPGTDDVVNVYGNNSMQSGSVTGAYMLDADYGSGGAWLRLDNASTSRAILPFECYIRASETITGKYKVIRHGMNIGNTTTDYLPVTGDPSSVTEKVLIDGRIYIIRGGRVYSADGQLVK